MNIENLKNEWFPLLFEKELKNRPISKVLLGQKLVIFKVKDEVLCFEDRCPHRNVPLSNGKIIDEKIRCNYHGWCFTKDGNYSCNKEIKIMKFNVLVKEKLIWINLNSNKHLTNYFKVDKNYSNKMHIKSLNEEPRHPDADPLMGLVGGLKVAVQKTVEGPLDGIRDHVFPNFIPDDALVRLVHLNDFLNAPLYVLREEGSDLVVSHALPQFKKSWAGSCDLHPTRPGI